MKEQECLCVTKCDPENCGTSLCKCSECWNPVTSFGCDGNWEVAHNVSVATQERERVLKIALGLIKHEGFLNIEYDDPIVLIPDVERCFNAIKKVDGNRCKQ